MITIIETKDKTIIKDDNRIDPKDISLGMQFYYFTSKDEYHILHVVKIYKNYVALIDYEDDDNIIKVSKNSLINDYYVLGNYMTIPIIGNILYTIYNFQTKYDLYKDFEYIKTLNNLDICVDERNISILWDWINNIKLNSFDVYNDYLYFIPWDFFTVSISLKDIQTLTNEQCNIIEDECCLDNAISCIHKIYDYDNTIDIDRIHKNHIVLYSKPDDKFYILLYEKGISLVQLECMTNPEITEVMNFMLC